MNDILLQGLNILGLSPTENQVQQLEKYIYELQFWNKRLNLVGNSDTESLIKRHILDSLAGFKVIKKLQGRSIADVGTGAGLPGILLSIFMEDRSFFLIERSGKKAGFLRSTVALLGLSERVKVINKDLKEVNQAYDIVVLRAFRDFAEFYSNLLSIKEPNGVIAAYKGRIESVKDDLLKAGVDKKKVNIETLNVPFLDEQRCMIILL